MPGIYPDYPAPIVRNGTGGRELVMARWGMPSSQKALMDATKKRADKLQAKGGDGRFQTIAAPSSGKPAAAFLRGPVDDVDQRAEGEGRRGHRRHLRVFNKRTER